MIKKVYVLFYVQKDILINITNEILIENIENLELGMMMIICFMLVQKK